MSNDHLEAARQLNLLLEEARECVRDMTEEELLADGLEMDEAIRREEVEYQHRPEAEIIDLFSRAAHSEGAPRNSDEEQRRATIEKDETRITLVSVVEVAARALARRTLIKDFAIFALGSAATLLFILAFDHQWHRGVQSASQHVQATDPSPPADGQLGGDKREITTNVPGPAKIIGGATSIKAVSSDLSVYSLATMRGTPAWLSTVAVHIPAVLVSTPVFGMKQAVMADQPYWSSAGQLPVLQPDSPDLVGIRLTAGVQGQWTVTGGIDR